jgi:hypothetical protein
MTVTGSPLEGRMIFLVGARRSGTNWLHRVVGAHPAVALVPSETYLFSRGIKQLRERLHHGVLGSPGTGFIYMDPAEMTRLLRELCDRIFVPFLKGVPGSSRVAERTPEHVTCLEVIGEIYPDASVVHVVRDGRDVARSLMAQAWESAPGSIEEAAAEWKQAVEAGEAAGRELAHYRTIHYEHVLAEPRKYVSDLYAWLGLETPDAIVDSALMEAEVRFNEDPGAPDVAAGKWRESFSVPDLQAFMSVAGDTLSRLGYDTDAETKGRALGSPTGKPGGFARLLRAPKPWKDRASLQRSLISHTTDNQRLLDRVVAAVLTRRTDRLRELVTPALWVRVVTPGESWKGRGEAGWDKLVETIESDPALDGKQIDGDLHAAMPTSTAVITLAAADGSKHLRMVALTIQEGVIERIVYYRFPLAAKL